MYALGEFPVNRQSGLYGKGTLSDTIRLQKRLHLTADGKVGPLTWTAIDPKLDLYGKALLTPKPKPVAPPGARVAHQARVMATYAPKHYTQVRPYAETLPVWRVRGGDCSGTSILIYKLAGCKDPNHTNYDGSGWTGSLIQQGVGVPEIVAKPGDLTFYGRGASDHVVVEIGGGLVVSHGSEGGPRTLPRHYRSDYMETRRYV
jgi:cell wall-associated NlpC family hydrolase